MKIKICGITDEASLRAAQDADFMGLVFYPASPRALDFEAAATLAALAAPRLKKVGLFVDPDDALLDRTLPALDMIQLHGAETPERVAAVRARTGLPVIKALRIAAAADVAQAGRFENAADWLLFDAKSPSAPGGTGEAFDWTLLADFKAGRPWMLAGGLTSDNIAQALAVLKPAAVDVSSGVESEPGVKSPALIRNFIEKVRSL